MSKIEFYAPFWFGHCTPLAKMICALQSRSKDYDITFVIYKLFEETLKAQYPTIKFISINPEFTAEVLQELMNKQMPIMFETAFRAYQDYFKTKTNKPDLMVCDFFAKQAIKYAKTNNIKLIVNFPNSYTEIQELINFVTLDRSVNVDGVLIHYSLPKQGFQVFDDILDWFRGSARVVFESFIGLDNAGIIPTHHSLIGFFEPEQEREIKVPEDLEDWMAAWKKQGKDKFIYIAFGSLVRLGQKFINQIIRIAQTLGYPIIWGLRSPFSSQVNHPLIYHRPWLPQQAILALPEVKAFMTHCGWGSISQSIISKTPIICVPVFADQPRNAKLVVDKQFGVQIFNTQNFAYPSLFEPQIEDEFAFQKIRQVIENPIYNKSIERLNKLNKHVNAGYSIHKIVYQTINFGYDHLLSQEYERATIKTGVRFEDILSKPNWKKADSIK